MITAASGDPTKYKQIAALLRDRIKTGDLTPGQPVPSITTVAAELGVSRGTGRQAMCLLLGEGLLTRYPGLGYYVAQQRSEKDMPGSESAP